MRGENQIGVPLGRAVSACIYCDENVTGCTLQHNQHHSSGLVLHHRFSCWPLKAHHKRDKGFVVISRLTGLLEVAVALRSNTLCSVAPAVNPNLSGRDRLHVLKRTKLRKTRRRLLYSCERSFQSFESLTSS